MSACSSQQYSQNVIINSEDALVKKEAELFFFDQNLSYEENKKISALFSYRKTGQKESGGSGSSYGNSWTSLDFLQLAYNNGAIWFGKNGTWQNSATLSEISAGTTTNAAFTGIDTSKHYTIAWEGYSDDMIELNAGNGYFRTSWLGGGSTVYNPSSGDTAARFKYEVPTISIRRT